MENFNLIQIAIDNFGIWYMIFGVSASAILSIIMSIKMTKCFNKTEKNINSNIIDDEKYF